MDVMIERENWNPNRVIYKYLSADGAFQTLLRRAVKCSSANAFNDPFDTVTEIQFEFNPAEFPEAFFSEVKSLIFEAPEPVFEQETFFSRMIRYARKNLDQFNSSATLESAKDQIAEQLQVIKGIVDRGNSDWQAFLSTWRICCLSEINDSLLMWAHYADKHSGAVVGFRCVPEVDSCFCAASRVNYSRELPTLGSLGEWIRHLIGLKRIDFDSRFMQMTFTKSIDWAYEKEVRYILPTVGDGCHVAHYLDLISLDKWDRTFA